MSVFPFDTVRQDVPLFGALPRMAWTAFDALEIVCAFGLTAPAAFRRQPVLTAVAAALAVESLVFVWVHAKCREIALVILCSVPGLLMAFLAYGRLVLRPIA